MNLFQDPVPGVPQNLEFYARPKASLRIQREGRPGANRRIPPFLAIASPPRW